MSNEYTWERNRDTEVWGHDIFDSAKECLMDAKENYGLQVGETIAIGEVKKFELDVDAEEVISRLYDSLCDEVGDIAENELDLSLEELSELGKLLTSTTKEYLTKIKKLPSCYSVVDIKTVGVE